MVDNFFNNNTAQPSTGAGFMAAPAPSPAPAGNPWMGNGQVNGAAYSGVTDPRMAGATAAMIYQRMGYWDGNPTEIDIFADILKASSPVSRFLASEQGFPALAQFFSVLIDYKLVSFFKEFKLGMVQDEATGSMYLQPLPEQPTDEGKRLATMTIAEVSTAMSSISEQLKNTLIAQADELLANHKQAAQMKASQTGIEGILSDAADGNSQGMISKVAGGVLNTGLRAFGVPVAPASAGPPPPPR